MFKLTSSTTNRQKRMSMQRRSETATEKSSNPSWSRWRMDGRSPWWGNHHHPLSSWDILLLSARGVTLLSMTRRDMQLPESLLQGKKRWRKKSAKILLVGKISHDAMRLQNTLLQEVQNTKPHWHCLHLRPYSAPGCLKTIIIEYKKKLQMRRKLDGRKVDFFLICQKTWNN